MSRRRTATPRRHSLAVLLPLLLIVAAACSRLPRYSHFEHVDADGWRRMDTLHFCVPLPDDAPCRLRLDLRINSRYPFTEAVLRISGRHTADTLGAPQHTELVAFDVADGEGNLRGHGLSLHEFSAALPNAEPHGRADTLCLSITHNMTLNPLPGITDVGITAEDIGH